MVSGDFGISTVNNLSQVIKMSIIELGQSESFYEDMVVEKRSLEFWKNNSKKEKKRLGNIVKQDKEGRKGRKFVEVLLNVIITGQSTFHKLCH